MRRLLSRRRPAAGFLIVALAAVAGCRTTKPPPGQADTKLHPEFASIRPVVIVVLRVDSPSSSFAPRRALYDRLFEKRYSPVSIERVEAHTSSDGIFESKDIAWDAKLIVRITRWERRTDDLHIANVDASLIHRTGETLWACRLRDQPVDSTGGWSAGESRFAKVLLAELPDLPPAE